MSCVSSCLVYDLFFLSSKWFTSRVYEMFIALLCRVECGIVNRCSCDACQYHTSLCHVSLRDHSHVGLPTFDFSIPGHIDGRLTGRRPRTRLEAPERRGGRVSVPSMGPRAMPPENFWNFCCKIAHSSWSLLPIFASNITESVLLNIFVFLASNNATTPMCLSERGRRFDGGGAAFSHHILYTFRSFSDTCDIRIHA